jgi:pumilio family protein 6
MAPKVANGGKRKAPGDVKDRVKKIKLDTSAQADARKYDPSRKFDASKRKRASDNDSNKYQTKKKFDSSRKSLVSKEDSDDDDNELSASDAEDGGAALKGRTAPSKFDNSKGGYNGRPAANGANGKTFERGECC